MYYKYDCNLYPYFEDNLLIIFNLNNDLIINK